jgi:UDP-glucose 4-epimerase
LNILVTGSAGYIGSHACLQLLENGYRVVGIDNYSRGNRGATAVLSQFHTFAFIEADIRDVHKLATTFRQYDVEAVMHFAAYAYVGESCERPLMYYSNNVGGSLSLLSAMGKANVSRLVFSSTCATYGEPEDEYIPIRENCPQRPINPYGHSKLMVEQAIRDFANSDDSPEGFAFSILRYFNVAGSDPQGRIGEAHLPETHLIPLCLNAALGRQDGIYIFGTDYPTNDGTCIRDYVHVVDLIEAHIKSLDSLNPGDKRVYNVGTGSGYSVNKVIGAVKRITGIDFKVEACVRRIGDPSILYSNPLKLKKELQWIPKHEAIETIIADAWRWAKANPEGYQG